MFDRARLVSRHISGDMFQIKPDIRLDLNWSIDYLGTLTMMVKEKPPGKPICQIRQRGVATGLYLVNHPAKSYIVPMRGKWHVNWTTLVLQMGRTFLSPPGQWTYTQSSPNRLLDKIHGFRRTRHHPRYGVRDSTSRLPTGTRWFQNPSGSSSEWCGTMVPSQIVPWDYGVSWCWIWRRVVLLFLFGLQRGDSHPSLLGYYSRSTDSDITAKTTLETGGQRKESKEPLGLPTSRPGWGVNCWFRFRAHQIGMVDTITAKGR